MDGERIKPLVGVTADFRVLDPQGFHLAGHKYVSAVAEASGAVPLLIPALGERVELAVLLGRLDGILLTGSPSDVEPHHYNGAASLPGSHHDPDRDATTLPLIDMALSRGVPLLAICRGLQELNVALGGSLHQRLHEVPGKRDHREPKDVPFDARYRAAHSVRLEPGGLLWQWAGHAGDVAVNSLHGQGIDRLADGMAIEAVSDDGVIEAVRVTHARSFALGVQWHPEHPVALEWPLSARIFKAFGDAARAYATERQQ